MGNRHLSGTIHGRRILFIGVIADEIPVNARVLRLGDNRHARLYLHNIVHIPSRVILKSYTSLHMVQKFVRHIPIVDLRMHHKILFD